MDERQRSEYVPTCELVVNHKTRCCGMHYTPGQLRDIVGISQETLRHWRTQLPPLATRGRAPCFKPGQLVGTAVIKTLVEDCGVSVGALRRAAPALFDLCDRHWEDLERRRISLDLKNGKAAFLDRNAERSDACVLVVVTMGSLIETLRERMFTGAEVGSQRSLHLPPVPVRTRSRSGAGER